MEGHAHLPLAALNRSFPSQAGGELGVSCWGLGRRAARLRWDGGLLTMLKPVISWFFSSEEIMACLAEDAQWLLLTGFKGFVPHQSLPPSQQFSLFFTTQKTPYPKCHQYFRFTVQISLRSWHVPLEMLEP